MFHTNRVIKLTFIAKILSFYVEFMKILWQQISATLIFIIVQLIVVVNVVSYMMIMKILDFLF
jgi:hypothetical protein